MPAGTERRSAHEGAATTSGDDTAAAPEPAARRLFELTEPISLVNVFPQEPNDVMMALGFRNYWDGYFAGRAAQDPRRPCRGPELARAADLLARAPTSAPAEGRVMYAGLRSLPVPEEPVARLWHAANLLREHRWDGHIVALVSERIGGTEAHVLSALDLGIHPAESFGWIHHLPQARLAEVMNGLRDSGLLDASGRFTDAGRAAKDRIEARTDALAEAPYEGLDPLELEQLIGLLGPISSRLGAAGSR